MNERELLEELVRQGERREMAEKIKLCAIAALILVIVVLSAVCIPKIIAPLNEVSRSMQQVEKAAEEAERILSDLDEDTVAQFKETLESLNESSQQIRVFVDTLKDSGIDKLQSTIEDLNDSLSSFGSFMSIFGR